MSACEKCWSDAYDFGRFYGCESQTERYYELLEERKDRPCTKKQQGLLDPKQEKL